MEFLAFVIYIPAHSASGTTNRLVCIRVQCAPLKPRRTAGKCAFEFNARLLRGRAAGLLAGGAVGGLLAEETLRTRWIFRWSSGEYEWVIGATGRKHGLHGQKSGVSMRGAVAGRCNEENEGDEIDEGVLVKVHFNGQASSLSVGIATVMVCNRSD